nr:TPA_asm: hypothetical protein [Schmimed tricladivirus]
MATTNSLANNSTTPSRKRQTTPTPLREHSEWKAVADWSVFDRYVATNRPDAAKYGYVEFEGDAVQGPAAIRDKRPKRTRWDIPKYDPATADWGFVNIRIESARANDTTTSDPIISTFDGHNSTVPSSPSVSYRPTSPQFSIDSGPTARTREHSAPISTTIKNGGKPERYYIATCQSSNPAIGNIAGIFATSNAVDTFRQRISERGACLFTVAVEATFESAYDRATQFTRRQDKVWIDTHGPASFPEWARSTFASFINWWKRVYKESDPKQRFRNRQHAITSTPGPEHFITKPVPIAKVGNNAGHIADQRPSTSAKPPSEHGSGARQDGGSQEQQRSGTLHIVRSTRSKKSD